MQRLYKRVLFSLILIVPILLIGQEESYRVFAEKVSFTDLLDILEKGYNVEFSYASDLLKEETFFIKSNTPDLSDILKEITAIYPIEYQVLENKSILLREKLVSNLKPASRYISILVVDQANKMPLEEVAVGLSGTNIGAYTDKSGKAEIKIPNNIEAKNLDFHYLGYQSKKVTLDKRKAYKIELSEQPFSIEEVMIQDRMDIINFNEVNHSVLINTSHISSLTSGIMGKDVVRQAQLLPGIASFNDISSGLQIRGAEEQSALIIIDEIPVYNANHYYGLFSTINPSYSAYSILYKNNLPVAYDGKTAGMLKVNGVEADTSFRNNGSLDLNLLTISGAIHLPFSKDVSLTIAGRSSYNNVSKTDLFSIFNNPVEEANVVENFSESTRTKLLSTVPDFKFYDLNTKMQHRWKDNDITFSYFQSFDDLDDTFVNTFLTRKERFVVKNEEKYSNTERWKNQGSSLILNYNLSDNYKLSATAYYSNYNNLSGLTIGLVRSVLDQVATFEYKNNRENIVQDLGIKSNVTFENENIKLQAGAEIVNHDITLDISEGADIIREHKRNEIKTSGYVSFSPLTIEKLNLEIGLRATSYRGGFYPSPRINLGYKISDGVALKAAAGRHNQYVRQISFENIFGRNLDFWRHANNQEIKVSKADNLMIGGNIKVGRVSFDLETYYKKTYNVLELALVDPRFNIMSILPISQSGGNRYEFFNGDGQIIGLDFMISLTEKNYSGWIAYTLSKSTIDYDRILVGESFPAQDDRRHQLKLINEYRIGRFKIGANFIFASGRPYTDLTKIVSSLRRDELSAQQRISRLPDYIRTDLGVSYRFKIENQDAEIGLSAYNLLNRQNVNYVQYLFSINTNTQDKPSDPINTLLGTESKLLDRTVNLNFSLKF